MGPIIEDIKTLMRQAHDGMSCSQIPRSGNTVAHLLANSVFHNYVKIVGVDFVPHFVGVACVADLAV